MTHNLDRYVQRQLRTPAMRQRFTILWFQLTAACERPLTGDQPVPVSVRSGLKATNAAPESRRSTESPVSGGSAPDAVILDRPFRIRKQSMRQDAYRREHPRLRLQPVDLEGYSGRVETPSRTLAQTGLQPISIWLAPLSTARRYFVCANCVISGPPSLRSSLWASSVR